MSSLAVPRLPGLTRTNSAPLPLQVLHHQSLLRQLQQQEEERLRGQSSRDYVKQVRVALVAACRDTGVVVRA